MYRHLTRCLVAGIVAMLPIGGTIISIVYVEDMLSAPLKSTEIIYLYPFPGFGIVLLVVLLYAIGLFVTTFLGRWLWKRVDSALESLPMIGGMYQTLKQILGYGSGKDAMFQKVALVPSVDTGGVQLGLLTKEFEDGSCSVFLPGSPNPTAGRLVTMQARDVEFIDASVADALKSLVSVGSVPIVDPA